MFSRFLKVEKHAASKEAQNCGTPKRGEYESERGGNLFIVRVTHDDKRGAEYRTWCQIRRKIGYDSYREGCLHKEVKDLIFDEDVDQERPSNSLPPPVLEGFEEGKAKKRSTVGNRNTPVA